MYEGFFADPAEDMAAPCAPRNLEYITIAWNCIETGVALTAGILAGSVALIGFGAQSLIEAVSGIALLWRMSVDHADPARRHRERDAMRICLDEKSWVLRNRGRPNRHGGARRPEFAHAFSRSFKLCQSSVRATEPSIPERIKSASAGRRWAIARIQRVQKKLTAVEFQRPQATKGID